MGQRPSDQDWYRGSEAPTVTGEVRSGDDGAGGGSKSAGRLMKEISEDFSTLFRKEIELAKQELGQQLGEKAKGAAIIAVAAVLGFFALIFLLLAIRDGFDNFLWTWLADIATAGVLLVLGVLGALLARRKLATPVNPELTKKTIKDDVEWAKNLNKQ